MVGGILWRGDSCRVRRILGLLGRWYIPSAASWPNGSIFSRSHKPEIWDCASIFYFFNPPYKIGIVMGPHKYPRSFPSSSGPVELPWFRFPSSFIWTLAIHHQIRTLPLHLVWPSWSPLTKAGFLKLRREEEPPSKLWFRQLSLP